MKMNYAAHFELYAKTITIKFSSNLFFQIKMHLLGIHSTANAYIAASNLCGAQIRPKCMLLKQRIVVVNCFKSKLTFESFMKHFISLEEIILLYGMNTRKIDKKVKKVRKS